MFPTEDEVVEAYAWVAQHYGLSPEHSRPAIRAALREAEHLAEDVYESPAAVLYVFARTPRAFGGHRTMTVLLTHAQVVSSGQRLDAALAEVAELARTIARRDAAYEDARAFFAEKLFPFAG